MKSLLRVRIRRLSNAVRQFGFQKYLVFSLFGLGMLGAIGLLSMKVFGYLYAEGEFPHYFKLFLSEKILLMVFLTMFMMLIISALVSTLNIFFLSRDLTLLLSAPVGTRKVFFWKYLEVFFSSALMVTFFALPVLFGYCFYFANTPVSILGVFFLFGLFMLSGATVGILLGLLIPAFFSVRKLQPVLSVLSIILMTGIVIFVRLLRPERLGNPGSLDNLMDFMAGFQVKAFAYFPFQWLSRGIHLISVKNTAGYIGSVGLFAGVLALFALGLIYMEKHYFLPLYDKLNKGAPVRFGTQWKKGPLPEGYDSLWKKEIKTFLRSPAQWSQLLIIAAIVVVFIINLKGIPLPHPSIKYLIAYMNLGMAAFVVAGLNSRFAFTTIPMENPGLAHVMASPFPFKKVLTFKLLVYLIPNMVIGYMLFFMGDWALKLDSFNRIGGSIFLFPVLIFLTLLSIYFSMNVSESVPITPQHLIMSRAGMASMLWSMFYIVCCLIYFIRPIFLFYYSRFTRRVIPFTEIFLWVAVFLMIHLVLIWLLVRRGRAKWLKREFI